MLFANERLSPCGLGIWWWGQGEIKGPKTRLIWIPTSNIDIWEVQGFDWAVFVATTRKCGFEQMSVYSENMKMRPRRLVCGALLIVGIGIAMAQAQVPITAKNWLTHPEIKKIRSVYLEVNELLKGGGLRREIRRFEDCGHMEDNLRERYINASGLVRKYVLGGGSDVWVTLEHTYDSQGRLRFVLVRVGTMNGSQYLYRIYFNEQEERIWENRKLVSGPGYPFDKTWPGGTIVRNPDLAFSADNPCREISADRNRMGPWRLIFHVQWLDGRSRKITKFWGRKNWDSGPRPTLGGWDAGHNR